MLKIGLSSYGTSGQAFHAPFIDSHPELELTCVLERNSDKSLSTYPATQIVKTYEELISNKHLDVIVVNTPTQLHYEMAKKALIANKHVVLEKPMTVNYSGAKELVKLAEEKKLVLSVFHNRRLESGFKYVKRLISENTLGKPLYFKTHFNRDKNEIGQKRWKEEDTPGAGMFYDLAPHLIDQAITLFGSPDKITSKLEKQRANTEVIDYFLLTFSYNSGLTVELEAGMFVKDVDEPKYILKGEKGIYTKQLEDHQEYLLKQGIYPSKYDPDKGKIVWNNGTSVQVTNEKGGYHEFYEDLHDVIINQKETIFKNSTALEVMKIMEYSLTNSKHF